MLNKRNDLEQHRIAAGEIPKMNGFRVGFARATGRQKAENGCRDFRMPVTEPRKIVIVAKARRVQKCVAAPLDQTPAVGDSNRGGQRAEKAVNALIRSAFPSRFS